MKVSILGSWREGDAEWKLRGTHTEFIEACHAIGRALGRYRQPIVVGGQSESTADLHVVRGIADELRGQTISYPLVEVLRPAGDTLSYEELAKENPTLFSFHVPTEARWSEAHLLSLREADVVVTIAGMKGTYQSGLAAIVARKKLVPVACFGGASAKLSASLETLGEFRQTNNFRGLNGPWTPHCVDLIIKLAGIAALPRVLLIHGRSPDWLKLREWLRDRAEIPEVVVMQTEFGAGETLLEKFERLASQIDKAIAVATPDDLGGLSGDNPSRFRPRARQNVWLEIGWFWGRLGRDSLMILSRGDVELPSDLTGLELDTYHDDPAEKADKMRYFLGLSYKRRP